MNGRIKLKASLIISIFFLGITCTAAAGRTIYVDADGPADFNNIQAAIDDANDGDTIIVADGTYTGFGNRDIDFLGKAIVLRSANGSEKCIIDCQGIEDELHRGFYFHNGEDSNSVLDGFTITNGYAHYGGGAIHCSLSSPIITNCIIRGNVAPVRFFPGPFYGTFLFNNGGGIYCFMSSSIIKNCYIVGNRVEGNGGGIGLSDSSPLICNCVIVGNIALHKSFGHGGAIHSSGSSPTIINCTVIENVAEERGGGIYCVYGGGGPIINSIFCRNIPDQIDTFLAGPVVTYSNVQDGWPGEGNIDVDPCFADVGYWDPNENPVDPKDDFWIEGDYHLLQSSPCIDSGDPNYVPEPNETDLDGRPRVINGRIDMGAYEYSPTIQAYVRIVPRTISLASSGKWIAAFLRLSEDYNVANIDPDSIFLENEIEPERFWLSEDNQIALIKFDREQVRNILSVGEIELTITGQLTDGTTFEATDVIRVLNKVGEKSSKKKK
ncbi:MAG: choice-of-anchor Q domain-containing protein [Planctomycetota bacterium]|jgi:predicted outer membrane repeat protein